MIVLRFVHTAAMFGVIFGLLLCISASGNPRDVEAFQNGLLLMVISTWIRLVTGEKTDP